MPVFIARAAHLPGRDKAILSLWILPLEWKLKPLRDGLFLEAGWLSRGLWSAGAWSVEQRSLGGQVEASGCGSVVKVEVRELASSMGRACGARKTLTLQK